MTRRLDGTPEEEVEEAAKRIKKSKEGRKSARKSDTWPDYLLNTMGIMPASIETDKGSSFWERVRENVRESDREVQRVSKYTQLRQQGFSAKEARRMRDWSQKRIDLMQKY